MRQPQEPVAGLTPTTSTMQGSPARIMRMRAAGACPWRGAWRHRGGRGRSRGRPGQGIHREAGEGHGRGVGDGAHAGIALRRDAAGGRGMFLRGLHA
jgi:hypothetical protein